MTLFCMVSGSDRCRKGSGSGGRGSDGPQPDPWQLATARVAGAVTLAGLAARLGEGELRETMGRGAEQLAEVAVHW